MRVGVRKCWAVTAAVLLCAATSFAAGDVITAPVAENIRVRLDRDLDILLLVTPHRGDAWTRLSKRVTGDAAEWQQIAALNKLGETLVTDREIRVPLELVRPDLRRQAISALFPEDRPTSTGWRHKVVAGSTIEGEPLWKIAEWFTGDGANYAKIRKANDPAKLSTRRGDTILIPSALLTPSFRSNDSDRSVAKPTRNFDQRPPVAAAPAKPVSKKSPRPAEVSDDTFEGEPAEPPITVAPRSSPPAPTTLLSAPASKVTDSAMLEYVAPDPNPHAIYRLQRGEALYSSVVVRFTGRVYAKDVNEVVDRLVEFNGIEDVSKLAVGYGVKIPLDLLDAEYRPASDPRRIAEEESKRQSARLGKRVAAKNLAGVTVILDAGHGGRDVGTSHDGVWESNYVYDVMCRLKKQLEKKTAARVFITTRSRKNGYAIAATDVLPRDTDHVVLTSPQYDLDNPVVGVHLRWYLANSILRKMVRDRISQEKVVFISLHADSLHPSLRGAMAYVPGGRYVTGTFSKRGEVYLARSEVRESPSVTQTEDDALEAEGLSTNLAESIIASFENADLKVHPFNPIRDNVVRNGREWVPAVIRFNKVPTRLLLEICNMGNADDLKLIRTRRYRQGVAEAIQSGIIGYFAQQTNEGAPSFELTAKAAK